MQQEHERLIGTAAHLSHEQEINTEHIKVRENTVTAFCMCGQDCRLVTGGIVVYWTLKYSTCT